jgi:hypothetical protein
MDSYTPVPYDFREVLDERIMQEATGKVFFWSHDDSVDELEGRIMKVEERSGEGLFACFDSNTSVRLDRIITLFGRPGPGFEAYDAFANQCLSCTAGVPL